jgi:hypothetical protein
MPTIEEAKEKLDYIIGKSRVDLYKPIHIAEVLYRSRTVGDFDISKLETFQNPSLRWRNARYAQPRGKNFNIFSPLSARRLESNSNAD